MARLGWTVLALAFVDELLAVTALGVWGGSTSVPWLLVWLAPALGIMAWATFASPQAPAGGPVVRPAVQILVFGLASAGLWASGHPRSAVGLLVFSVAVNGLALTPGIRDLPARATGVVDQTS